MGACQPHRDAVRDLSQRGRAIDELQESPARDLGHLGSPSSPHGGGRRHPFDQSDLTEVVAGTQRVDDLRLVVFLAARDHLEMTVYDHVDMRGQSTLSYDLGTLRNFAFPCFGREIS
jgi:hypothetical protein